MTTITIPQLDKPRRSLRLVAISEDQYDEYLYWKKTGKKLRYFKASAAELLAIKASRERMDRGEYVTWEAVKKELGL